MNARTEVEGGEMAAIFECVCLRNVIVVSVRETESRGGETKGGDRERVTKGDRKMQEHEAISDAFPQLNSLFYGFLLVSYHHDRGSEPS